MFHEPHTIEEARSFRYRKWAGSPSGTAYNERHCAASVADGGRSVLSHQCSNRNGYGPAGLYCKTHAKMVKPTPEAKEEKCSD